MRRLLGVKRSPFGDVPSTHLCRLGLPLKTDTTAPIKIAWLAMVGLSG
jgi:hypothetical protein